MKTNVVSTILAAFLLLWFCNSCSKEKKPAANAAEDVLTELEQDEPEPGLKYYGIRSGIIEYKHSGQRTGTSILYFDKYGHRSAMYSDLIMNGQPDKTWAISLDDIQYVYKEGSKQGMKMKNPLTEELATVKDLEKFTEEIYAQMGFKPAGTESYQGKECRAFKGDMGKVLAWNGLLMYMEMNVMGTTTKQEAVKVDVNTRVKPSVFDLPGNVTFSEMTMPAMEGVEQ